MINSHTKKSKHPLYNTWKQLKKGNKSIPKHWDSFVLFLKDLPKMPRIYTFPAPIYKLFRIDKYLPYSKDNVYWKKIKYNTDNTNEINTHKHTTTNISTEIPDLD